MGDLLIIFLVVIALVFIGAIAVISWTIKKGHKGYTKTRDAIKKRRDEKR